MRGSVQNFDRDMTYAAPTLTEITPAAGPVTLPISVETPAQRIVNVGQVTNSRFVFNVASGAANFVGLVTRPPIASSRRVYRVKGYAQTQSDLMQVSLGIGYCPEDGGTVTVAQDVYVHADNKQMEFDETICVSSALIADPALTDNENIVFFLRFWNRDSTAYTEVGAWHMSVQDLGTAPPEYDAARR